MFVRSTARKYFFAMCVYSKFLMRLHLHTIHELFCLELVTSQRFGAHDEEGVRKSFASAIILMTGFGIILTVLSSAFLDPLLRLMNTPEDIYADSYSYISVICGGLLAPVFYNLLAIRSPFFPFQIFFRDSFAQKPIPLCNSKIYG